MELAFEKYHGNGNDFIIVDNMDNSIALTADNIAALCHRRFGIGADGLMMISRDEDCAFKMTYFNADGFEGSMCGNGGRCIAAYAYHKGVAGKEMTFKAFDGLHKAVIQDVDLKDGRSLVSLQLLDVSLPMPVLDGVFVDTGSPHYIVEVDDINSVDVVSRGRRIRNDAAFSPQGTNVNFVQQLGDQLFVRTYERGVEDETLSCGTGVTAVAAALAMKDHLKTHTIYAPGGSFKVDMLPDKDGFNDVWLHGPAQFIMSGQVEVGALTGEFHSNIQSK